ncbi:unnamed protein product [Ilex paraguariensis]|uniref:Uncharacterized protein n=1 Tax=Ilex paraguariensis TaxID=185542 RepID=A0ABC8TYT6_9AQUA
MQHCKAMESLIELCDLIAQDPSQFADKLAWICGQCPPIDSVRAGSLRVSRSQLNAVLATARFLSKCSSFDDMRPKPGFLGFLGRFRILSLNLFGRSRLESLRSLRIS